MNTTENDWIKDSERTAGINDLPVEVIRPDGHRYITYQWPPITHVTHWRKLCAPPPKEKTQREEDEYKFQLWLGSQRGDYIGWKDIWRAALAYRDKQNAEDFTICESGIGDHFALKRLRRRCGLDK